MSHDVFSDLTGLSSAPQPMRTRNTRNKSERSIQELLKPSGTYGESTAPALNNIVHDLSDLEQITATTEVHDSPAPNAFDLFKELALPNHRAHSERKVPQVAPSLTSRQLDAHKSVQQAVPSSQPARAQLPQSRVTQPLPTNGESLPAYEAIISPGPPASPDTSDHSVSQSHTRPPAVYVHVEDDAENFPYHEPPALPTRSRHTRSSSRTLRRNSSHGSPSSRSLKWRVAKATCDPISTTSSPVGNLLDLPSGAGTSHLEDRRTVTSECQPASETADLLSGFSPRVRSTRELGKERKSMQGTVPQHAAADLLSGDTYNPATIQHAGQLGVLAASHVSDIFDMAAGSADASNTDYSQLNDIDDDFFMGGVSGGTTPSPVNDESTNWMRQLGGVASFTQHPSETMRRGSQQEKAETGDVMLEKAVEEAQAACLSLPPERSERIQVAINQSHAYVAERVEVKRKIPNVTPEGLHYAKLSAARTAASMLQKTVEHHMHEARQEQDVADANEYRDTIKAEIKAWAFQGGTRKGLRNLLITLDRVLWEGAQWKCNSLADVSTDAQLKKWLNKSRLLLHTDKMAGQPEKIRLRAELILIEIDKALKGV